MELQEHPPHTVLFRQGDIGDTYYLVFTGELGMYLEPEHSQRKAGVVMGSCMSSVASGEGFGELALLDASGAGRALTALTHTAVQLITVTRGSYERAMTPHLRIADEHAALDALRVPPAARVPWQHAALATWAQERVKLGKEVKIEQLSRVMELQEHAAGSTLSRQGDDGDAYYLVFSGEVGMCARIPHAPAGQALGPHAAPLHAPSNCQSCRVPQVHRGPGARSSHT